MKKQLFLTALLLLVRAGAMYAYGHGEHLVSVVVQDDGSARVSHMFTMNITPTTMN